MRFDFSNILRELREEEADNIIVVRLGKTGSGKTLVQTEINVLPLLLEGQMVRCCYWLNWDTEKYPNLEYFSPRDFDKIKFTRNCTIVFDEVARSFPARGYDQETSDFWDFIQLHRHRHNTIIANTQDISLVAKTIGVQAHSWSQCEKVVRSPLLLFFDKVFEHNKIVINEDFLSYGELKRIALGWEQNIDPEIKPDWETHVFTKEQLIHSELDEYKIELVHRYCPRCKSRQGEQIKKADTLKFCNPSFDNKGKLLGYSLKEIEYCPKHKNTSLVVRLSGMFDTDYEPEPDGQTFKIVRYKVCHECGKDSVVK